MSVFNIDKDGNLTLNDPQQPQLDEPPARGGLEFSHANGVGTSSYRLAQTSYDILQIQRIGDTTGDGNHWTLVDLMSPTAQSMADSEATLSLTTRAGAPGNVSRTLDIYNDEYSRDNGMGFRQLYKNTAPNPIRFELHDKTTNGGAFNLGEIYAYQNDLFFTSIDSERTGVEPTVDDWVWDNAGAIFADDTKIIGVETDTPSAGVTTYHINRPVVGNGDPGTARGKSIKEIMRLTADRRLLVRKFIATGDNTVAEFGGNVGVDGKLTVEGERVVPVGQWQSWAPTVTGFSSEPSGAIYLYRIIGDEIELAVRQPNDGASNAPTFTISLPVEAAEIPGMVWQAMCRVRNNSNFVNNPGYGSIASGATIMELFINTGTISWGTANGKRVDYISIKYRWQ